MSNAASLAIGTLAPRAKCMRAKMEYPNELIARAVEGA